MRSEPGFIFQGYSAADKAACLAIFDQNCPRHFSPNERPSYQGFLDEVAGEYECCLSEGVVVAAYGLIGAGITRRSLNWILISPQAQGMGIGTAIMNRVIELATQQHLETIDIAASHLSEGFFAKQGAQTIQVHSNGWGPGMHRVDMELRLSV